MLYRLLAMMDDRYRMLSHGHACSAVLVAVACGGCLDWNSLSPDLDAECASSEGLVAYWPFDEGEGPFADDRSPSDQTVELSGATWMQGQLGHALAFDGASIASIPSTSGLGFDEGKGSFSVSYWLSPTTWDSTTEIRPLEITCDGLGYFLVTLSSGGAVGLTIYDDTNSSVSTWSIREATIGHWTHVAHVVDRTSGLASTYIGGALSGAPSNLSALKGVVDCSMSPRQLLSSLGGWDKFYYKGGIDDVRIFSRSLAANEVMELAQLRGTGCPR